MILGGIGRSEAKGSANLQPGRRRAALRQVIADEVEYLPLTRCQDLLGMGRGVWVIPTNVQYLYCRLLGD